MRALEQLSCPVKIDAKRTHHKAQLWSVTGVMKPFLFNSNIGVDVPEISSGSQRELKGPS